MSGVVLDASAFLALAFDEAGADVVEPDLPLATISAVNWAEIVQALAARHVDPALTLSRLLEAGCKFEPLGLPDATRAGELRPLTAPLGISLADRCCLAVAERLGRPVLTADRALADVDCPAQIRLIR